LKPAAFSEPSGARNSKKFTAARFHSAVQTEEAIRNLEHSARMKPVAEQAIRTEEAIRNFGTLCAGQVGC
jgi:hypothetical protein